MVHLLKFTLYMCGQSRDTAALLDVSSLDSRFSILVDSQSLDLDLDSSLDSASRCTSDASGEHRVV